MKKIYALLGCSLLWTSVVLAQEPADKPVADKPEVAAPAPVATPETETATLVDGQVKVGDLLAGASEVAKAVTEYRAAKTTGDKAALRLGILAALAAIFKFLLSALKLSTPFWKSDKGKAILRLSTLALSCVVFVVAKLAVGESYMSALTLAMSGPLAVAFHEYTYLIPTIAKMKKKVVETKPEDKKV